MKTIFKPGDRVFDIQYGWGEVERNDSYALIVVKFQKGSKFYKQNGCRPNSYLPTLSFTEYTLEGLSHERPINYKDYIGKFGKFWNNEWGKGKYVVDILLRDRIDGYGLFQSRNGGWYDNFKPLSEEQIKMLEL